jgi:hypothetical protein
MAGEEKTKDQNNDPQFSAQDYIDNLNALKENMVSRDEYNKILADNKKLVNALSNGGGYSREEKKQPVDLDELRRQLFSPQTQHKTDLEYFTQVMQLRDAVIERGGQDPFLPFNRDYIPTQQDIDDANRIADNIKECIEYAEGDPRVFTVALQKKCNYTGRRK